MLDFFLGALIEDPAARGRVWPPVDEAFWPSQVSSGSTEMLDAAARLVATRYSDGEPPVVEELEELRSAKPVHHGAQEVQEDPGEGALDQVQIVLHLLPLLPHALVKEQA